MRQQNTNIVQRKPYTVIVDWADEVYIYDKPRKETMGFLMQHGLIALPRHNATLAKSAIKKMFEVNTEKNTSVENRIYQLPSERCKRMIHEQNERKKRNGVGIASIEIAQEILSDLQGRKKQHKQEEKQPVDPKRVRKIMKPFLDQTKIKKK